MRAIDVINEINIPNLSIIDNVIFINDSAVDYFLSESETINNYIIRTYKHINNIKPKDYNIEYITEYLNYISYLPINTYIRKLKLQKIMK